MEELGLFMIKYDENGYEVLAIQWETMTMTTFVRVPEFDGPNYIHRKTWFNDDDELESRASVYTIETDEEYKGIYERGDFNNMSKYEDHKEEILKKYKNYRKNFTKYKKGE